MGPLGSSHRKAAAAPTGDMSPAALPRSDVSSGGSKKWQINRSSKEFRGAQGALITPGESLWFRSFSGEETARIKVVKHSSVSTGQLKRLPALHHRPINLVVFQGTSGPKANET